MLITNKQFEALHAAEGQECVTFYMPTQREGDGLKARQRFESLLQKAVSAFQEREKNKEAAQRFLEPAYGLLEDPGFWTYMSDGLAVFVSEETMEHYILPIDFEPFVFTGHHFYLRPLLPVLSGEGRFFLLALAHNDIKLYEGTHYSLRPIHIENLIPVDYGEAMKTAYAESDVHMYTGEGAASKPILESRGEEAPKEIRDIWGYFRQIDEGLSTVLEGLRAPLVLAAPQRLVPIFLDITNYTDTMDFYVEGDPADKSEEYLHSRAWSQLVEHHKTMKDEFREQFSDLQQDGKGIAGTNAIIKAAYHGKVKVLFNRKGAHLWGRFDPDKEAIKEHEERRPDSEDLMERSAVHTYLKGGRVFEVAEAQMPQTDAPMNAVIQ